jgi:hypothetical protein
MNGLSIQSWTMPAADLGLENPLPPLETRRSPTRLEYPADLPKEMLDNIVYGNLSNILPYTFQDGFNRQLQTRDLRVAVLENENLQATFLLEFGGRLWSLRHKPSGRELLEVNPVFQLANLALRKAWFSGGVEWNIGTLGHSPFTCSPLFACRIEGDNGMPILRFYEWERFRQTPFQIDAYLPEGSQVLFIRTRIINPNEAEVPIYWWSNIAVPETADTRVVVPAESAYCLGCRPNHLERVSVPKINGVDFTYSTRVKQAADFFFDLTDCSYPWIAALDGNGQGLVQVSTNEMVGRKLWVWGTGRGGRNWQQFLSPPGKGYIEIQSGLTRTQLEHKPLPPETSCSWLEAYGFLETDPGIVHGADWIHAYQHVDVEVQRLIPAQDLDKENRRGAEFSDSPPGEYYQKGSGWGALERRRREVFSAKPLTDSGLVFGDDSLAEEQEPWLKLLESGTFPLVDENSPCGSFVVSGKWGDLIEQALEGQSAGNWFAWYQAGIARYHAGNRAGAVEAWKRSLELTRSPWAARNLAQLAWSDGQIDWAANLMVEALSMAPSIMPLAVECGACLYDAERYEEWLQMIPQLPQSVRSDGRIRLLEAQSAFANGELDTVEKFFKDQVVVADLREGENSLSDLWIDYQVQKMSLEENLPINHPTVVQFREHCPVPERIDFRMREETSPGE